MTNEYIIEIESFKSIKEAKQWAKTCICSDSTKGVNIVPKLISYRSDIPRT